MASLSLIILGLATVLNIPQHSFMPNLLVEDSTTVNYIYPEKTKEFKKYNDAENNNFKNPPIQYKPFNPNKYSKNDWKSIGFSEKQAKVILKYKNQIGGFKSKNDLSTCFVISKKKFNELQAFIKFDTVVKKDLFEKDTAKTKAVIELNTADQILLESVSGIGPFFAKKIIELRVKLNGFHSVSQIKEIYGMTAENYTRIEPQLKADASEVRPIVLQEASFDQLKKHPYLNWKQSQVLVSLSNKNINDKFWESLLLNEAFLKEDITRVKPYLK